MGTEATDKVGDVAGKVAAAQQDVAGKVVAARDVAAKYAATAEAAAKVVAADDVAVHCELLTDEEIRHAFDRYDVEGTGDLDKDEVLGALSLLSLRRDTDAADLFSRLDINNDGAVNVRPPPQTPPTSPPAVDHILDRHWPRVWPALAT